MDEVTIELSTLLKVSVSTYYGPFDYNDCIYEMGKEDLEGICKNNDIIVKPFENIFGIEEIRNIGRQKF